jgi:fumarate hydratase class II
MHGFGGELGVKPVQPARSRGSATAFGGRAIAFVHMATKPVGAPDRELWGPETGKAVENFPVSGERVPVPVVRWLGRIKAAAARVNAELGLLDPELADRIARAADEVAAGEHDDQFPIDVFQTGSGTSSNMNSNEVIASLAGEGVHPNDHVNMGQSSNDVFPSAVHLAAVDSVRTDLLPALDQLASSLQAKADQWADVVKAGRTHMMDAVPVTLGQEFGGYAAQIALGRDRVRDALGRAAQIPLGGTATGTGLNTHPEFAERVRRELALGDAPLDRFEAQGNRDALVELHGALKVVAVSLTKIANDLVLMGSGPRTGLVELQLPELQKGSSIMPGKVNPVIPEVVLQVAAQVIGNDTAVTVAGSQGNFELNVRVPMIARNLFESIQILGAASRLLAERCVDGLESNEETLRRHAESTPAIATALNPHIGYDRATEIVKEAVASRRTIREVALEKGVDAETLDKALDLRAMARGSKT